VVGEWRFSQDSVRLLCCALNWSTGFCASADAGADAVKAQLEGVMKQRDERRGPDRLNRKVSDYKNYGKLMPYQVQVRQVRLSGRFAFFFVQRGTTVLFS
jgi:osmotically-inducible protein OsmY